MPQLQETFHVWACILAQILQNFLRSPLALVAAEVGVLPDAPARVTAQKIRVAGGVAQRSPAGIVGADAREDTLQLLQAVVSVALNDRRVISRGIGRRWRISSSSMSARIIDEQTT